MIPWELLDSARVPESGEEMRLYRRGAEYSIRVDEYELMNSRAHYSEDLLAEIACERLGNRPDLRILIGGLGMGYTVSAALKRLGASGRVVVAEIVPAVVDWNMGIIAGLAGSPLKDARVSVRKADVALIMRERRGAYDAILLDVDNGPAGLTRKDNIWLYQPTGLAAAYEALRPGGMLAIWASGPDKAFVKLMRHAGFIAEELSAKRVPRGGGKHTIWLARRGE
jgi:spermidine synthase